tara:strand:+ start:476 stop:835 length:360 start_codon:yes stop_codon:yes gene_type:complete
MSTKVSAFSGGLGIDARNKFEILANATVTVGDGSTTGNINVGTITAGTYNGLSSNAITDGDSAVSIIDPAVSLISNGLRYIVIDKTQGVETQFIGNVSIGTNDSNTFSITGKFDLGAFS